MVISETIICQRFIQNAWKKDLCSNCFKSKEDHVVIPEKKITYRWTSHVNNFPQHGILKDRQKNGEEKRRTVSFLTEESEVIGFGGEEYSSDDDDYPTYQEAVAAEADNEEEDKEFRKLTKSNTDFNSVPANLKNERCAAGVGQPKGGGRNGAYAELKFGVPVLDAEGRRQTLQVTVEPFRNSVTVVNGACNGEAKSRPNRSSPVNGCLRNDKTDKKWCEIKKNSDRDDETGVAARECCGDAKSEGAAVEKGADEVEGPADAAECLGDLSAGCDSSNKLSDGVPEDPVNVLNVCLNEAEDTNNVFVKGAPNVTEDSKYTKVSTVVVVDGSPSVEEVVERAADSSPSKPNCCEDPSSDAGRPKSPYRSFSPPESSLTAAEKRPCSMSKDCNPINLPPLMVCKALDIEFDSPGSREMVGEPDGKADSDDSGDPVLPPATHAPVAPALHTPKAVTAVDSSSVYVNPQRSFLHDFSDGSKKQKPVGGAAADETPKTANPCKESAETLNGLSCTPKLQIPITCNGTGSVKRQAPKPPSTKIIGPSPLFTAPGSLEDNVTPVSSRSNTLERPPSKCESPLVSGQRDAISFLASDPCANSIRRKLNLDAVAPPNRSSLNVCISPSPNSYDTRKRYSTFTGSAEPAYMLRKDPDSASICSVDRRSPSKCSRSLSCDSIISPSVMAALPEKTRKYSGATIKVKSKIRKLLRFNHKEDEKFENDVPCLSAAPRKRIEIIHPLDLNKSTIEILGSNTPNLVNGDSDVKKKTEIENAEVNGATAATSSPASTTCSAGRPNKPPPPPRTQSLDQKYTEISRPVRPPPPKCGSMKPSPSPSLSSPCRMASNLYENIGQSRNGIAPAKPQRAASIRERTRQIVSVTSVEESFATLMPDHEAAPECDRNSQAVSKSSDSNPATPVPYCGTETDSDIYDNVCKNNSDRKNSVVHRSLEDNYGAVVIANHEALSQLFERVNEATLVPTSLKVLQTTLHIRFDHLSIDEESRIVVADWHFFNALWNNQKMVVSVSTRHFGPLRTLPSCITLYPLIKFNDVIPNRILNGDSSDEMKTNAYITVWNEEHVETLDSFCSSVKTNSSSGCGLFLTQLANILVHLQNSGVNNVSLEEILICKRESLVEPKLLLLPFNVDTIFSTINASDRHRMTLCNCISTMANRLIPMQMVTQTLKNIADEGRPNAVAQIKAVVEYWLWGPSDAIITGDRKTSLRRWLDLERANCLHKMICKSPSELSLHEICHMMFLVRTDAKTLTEASFVFESQS